MHISINYAKVKPRDDENKLVNVITALLPERNYHCQYANQIIMLECK